MGQSGPKMLSGYQLLSRMTEAELAQLTAEDVGGSASRSTHFGRIRTPVIARRGARKLQPDTFRYLNVASSSEPCMLRPRRPTFNPPIKGDTDCVRVEAIAKM